MNHGNVVVYVKHYCEDSAYVLVTKTPKSDEGKYKVLVEELTPFVKK